MPKKKKRDELTPEERESYGQWARRVWTVIKENEKAAGKPVSEADLASCDKLCEPDREVFRQSGEDLAVGDTRREEAMWAELERRRAEIGEKPFRETMFSLCVSIALDESLPPSPSTSGETAADVIVKMAGMLDAPNWPLPQAATQRAKVLPGDKIGGWTSTDLCGPTGSRSRWSVGGGNLPSTKSDFCAEMSLATSTGSGARTRTGC